MSERARTAMMAAVSRSSSRAPASSSSSAQNEAVRLTRSGASSPKQSPKGGKTKASSNSAQSSPKMIGKLVRGNSSAQTSSTQTSSAQTSNSKSPKRSPARSPANPTSSQAAQSEQSLLGPPGNVTPPTGEGDERDPDTLSDVVMQVSKPETFQNDLPTDLLFSAKIPSASGRLGHMQTQWNSDSNLYMEACIYMYHPHVTRTMGAVWRDKERKLKFLAWLEKFQALLSSSKDIFWNSVDEFYLEIIRPPNFLNEYPEATRYLENLRQQSFEKLAAQDKFGVDFLRNTYGVDSKNINSLLKWTCYGEYFITFTLSKFKLNFVI